MISLHDIDEIKLLIILSGNQRLPHLEEEIFADYVLAELYLHNLCRDKMRVISDLYYDGHIMPDLDTLAYRYATRVLKQRWHVAEQLIKSPNKTGNWWRDYCSVFDIME